MLIRLVTIVLGFVLIAGGIVVLLKDFNWVGALFMIAVGLALTYFFKKLTG